ncbi:chondroadherin-like [Haliotis asinina]|uniref:chondroadherin-like n=1 Tax=Haliotis asinina TaxID=109174 RepID=UPI0035325EE5
MTVKFLFPILTLLSVGKCGPDNNCRPEMKCPMDLPPSVTCLTMVRTPCDAFKDGMMTIVKLGSLRKLQTLIINDCNIIMFRGSPFAGNADLTDLQLISNRFGTYDNRTFQNLRKLESLKITRSNVAVLPDGAFKDLVSLIHLNLQLNHITTIKQGSFSGLGRLQTLDLSYNSITTIEANTFDSLTSLQSITLQNNQISSLPDAVFEKVINLNTLTLKSNNLTKFTTSLTLDKLDLSSNELTLIPKAHSKMLELENNKISIVKSGDFVGMTTALVDLKHNPIFYIEPGAFSGSTISELNLDSTKLTSLPQSMSSLTNKNTTLKLDMNPDWKCVCDQLWLARYLKGGGGGGPSCSSLKHVGQKLGDIVLDLEAECMTTTTLSSSSGDIKTVFPKSTKLKHSSSQGPEEAGQSSPAPIIVGVTCAILLAAAVILGLMLWNKKFKVKPSQASPRHMELPDALTSRSEPGKAPSSTGCHQGFTNGPLQKRFLSP